MCLYHFCAAACLGGFWHKVTDQCADWAPGVPAGASRIPPVSLPAGGRSSGRGQGNRLLRPIRRRLFAAARTPRQNRPFTGVTGKKGDRPGVGAPERSGSCGRNPQIPHSYFTLCRRILQLFRVRKLLWGCRATIHIGQSLHRVWLWGSVRDLLQPKAGVKLPVSRGRFVVDWKREGAKSQHTGTVSHRTMPGGPERVDLPAGLETGGDGRD